MSPDAVMAVWRPVTGRRGRRPLARREASWRARVGDIVAGGPGKGAVIDKAAQATTASGARSGRGEGAAAAEAEAMAVG